MSILHAACRGFDPPTRMSEGSLRVLFEMIAVLYEGWRRTISMLKKSLAVPID